MYRNKNYLAKALFVSLTLFVGCLSPLTGIKFAKLLLQSNLIAKGVSNFLVIRQPPEEQESECVNDELCGA